MKKTKNVEDIAFHDCVINGIEITESYFCFLLSHVDVLKVNPLNATDVARKTDDAKLLLYGYKIENITEHMAEGNKYALKAEEFSEPLEEIINGESIH